MQRGGGKKKGRPFEFTHHKIGRKTLEGLTKLVADELGFDPGVNRKFTGHSTRRTGNTVSYQNGATERQRQKRFGYSEDSVAMRRYENPAVEDVRRENIEQFGVGGKRKREDTEDIALANPNPKTQAAIPLCDDWLADDMLQMPLDELFASCDRAISQHQRAAPPNRALALHQGNNSNVHIIDLRGNTGTINLNLGSAPNPVVLE